MTESGNCSPGVDYDIIVIGAGISGINTAYRIQTELPNKSWTMLEARDAIGGTWDLFRYPGIRSDSDLHTFGFSWRPWNSTKSIADGDSILEYMKECADVTGISQKIQFRHRVNTLNWSSKRSSWSLSVTENGAVTETITARWVVFGTGYYSYEKAMPVTVPGIENFEGTVIHPQFWPTDFDYTSKKIVVIGSGATAITLLPALAEKASHVIMLQRTPTFIFSQPQKDTVAAVIRKILPSSFASKIIRLKWIFTSLLFFKYCRAFPNASRKFLLSEAKKQLPSHIPVDPHFSPPYNPWEQRLCSCPSGDFYKVLSDGKGSVITANIDTIDEKAIHLKDSNEVLCPDVIVTATGLNVQLFGGANVTVDDQKIDLGSKHIWRGAMVEGLPNVVAMIGYTNASWTLGADANATLFVRIVKQMDIKGAGVVTPTATEKMADKPLLNLNSTYLNRVQKSLPKAGDKGPWRPRNDYWRDVWTSKYGGIEDGLKYT
ncbi:monooxygenase flavin-binding family protein-like protein [Ilyonectria sp. MPI-CAGE-AT-0026]|nr:monooxygenase flavin-binding family protein-like protein [Ilyonectria sp. MPI-CAGE-AT-0026]